MIYILYFMNKEIKNESVFIKFYIIIDKIFVVLFFMVIEF